MHELTIPETIRHYRILVVDDAEMNRRMLSQTLIYLGFEAVREAQGGKEALTIAAEWKPELLLLDLMMPEVDGFAVCEALANNAELGRPIIIAQTALSALEHKNRLFAAGATDYITKPLDVGELVARTVAHLEKRHAAAQLGQRSERMSRDLSEAASLQRSLMPAPAEIAQLETRYHVTLEAYYQASDELGGDVWGAVPVDETQLAVYLVDFSGHGLIAALNTFRLHTMLHTEALPFAEPAALLKSVNAKLKPLLSVGDFATMWYGVVDIAQNTLTYASAAAPPPMIKTGAGNVTMLHARGLPLGATREADWEQHTAPFHTGDHLFAYSDGLSEQPGTAEAMLSDEALTAMVQSASGLNTLLTQALGSQTTRPPVGDDVTAFWLSRN